MKLVCAIRQRTNQRKRHRTNRPCWEMSLKAVVTKGCGTTNLLQHLKQKWCNSLAPYATNRTAAVGIPPPKTIFFSRIFGFWPKKEKWKQNQAQGWFEQFLCHFFVKLLGKVEINLFKSGIGFVFFLVKKKGIFCRIAQLEGSTCFFFLLKSRCFDPSLELKRSIWLKVRKNNNKNLSKLLNTQN